MSNQMLKEISTWKLDAKFEEVNRYFYNIDEFKSITNGERCFVIGRKGSGKTAISEKIYIQSSPKLFTEKLTFKNFPFNELYSLQNDKYTRPNQYITLWKYLIYSSICRMMVRNQSIDSGVRVSLEKIYGGTEPAQNLSRLVSRWVTGGFGLSILGIGGQVTGSKAEPDVGVQSWIDRVDILEDVVSQYLDDSEYYILFDELDEDYRSIVELGDSNKYLSLITSLFKAVQVVRSIFVKSKHIFPIIFLRDDIYDLVLDPDKNKWDDFRIDLD
jgi:Cdc6-like AAA superfamily ATPase